MAINLIMGNNFNQETIYLIEDSFINEFSCLEEDLNSSSTIVVKFENAMNVNQKILSINELKKNFNFIKIKNDQNDMNFLVLKKNYSSKDILMKINSKPIYGDEIKNILKVNKFPLDNHYLDEKEEHNNLYDKIYFLGEFREKDNKKIINKNNNIMENLNILVRKINVIEQNLKNEIEDDFNAKNSQLDEIIVMLKQLKFNKIENAYLNQITDNPYINEYNRLVLIKIKNEQKYLCMTDEREVFLTEIKFPWDIQINYSTGKIIFKADKYFLTEENRILKGDENTSKWGFKILEKNIYLLDHNNNFFEFELIETLIPSEQALNCSLISKRIVDVGSIVMSINNLSS